jgi:hypothetical protein
LEQVVKTFTNKVAEMAAVACLVWEPAFVDELAKVEQESVNLVVAVELHPAKMVSPQVYGLDWGKPSKHVIYVGRRCAADRSPVT